jgi:hypothetical protein
MKDAVEMGDGDGGWDVEDARDAGGEEGRREARWSGRLSGGVVERSCNNA